MEPIREENAPARSPLRRFAGALGAYLKDWRNLLGHALLGVVFLVLAIYAPVDVRIKLAVIAALVVFNVLRMRRGARKAAQAGEQVEG
jgi:hypothetical protein